MKGYKGDYKKVMTEIRKLSRESKYDNRWRYASRGEEDSTAFIYDRLFGWVGRGGQDIDEHFDRTRVKKYHEMNNYEAFDTFLTEKIKNSICEDNLGDILSFLCNTSVKYKIDAVLGDGDIPEPMTFYTKQKAYIK